METCKWTENIFLLPLKGSIRWRFFSLFVVFLVQVPDNTFVCNYLKDGKLFFNEPKLRAESHLAVAESKLQFL